MKTMKTIKILCLFTFMVILFTSCAEPKTFQDVKGSEYTVEPYGLFNTDTKVDSVVYKVSVGNIVWSVLLSETIVVPVVLVGWYLYEPAYTKKTPITPNK